MSSARDITRAASPPRSVYLDYPLGHTSGRPHDAVGNTAILSDTLEAFEALTVPGSMAHLNYRWAGSDSWKQKVFAPSGMVWEAGELVDRSRTVSGSKSGDGEEQAESAGERFEDDRVQRFETPQYQTEQDAETAELAHADQECLVCEGVDY